MPLLFDLEETAFTIYANNNNIDSSDLGINIRCRRLSPYVPVAIGAPRRALFTIYTDDNNINFSGRDTKVIYSRIYSYVLAAISLPN